MCQIYFYFLINVGEFERTLKIESMIITIKKFDTISLHKTLKY
jgi:hypothetical protein